MIFSSLAALAVVILTTFGATSDENFAGMTFPFSVTRWKTYEDQCQVDGFTLTDEV